jgi:DNA-binding protein Alba
MTSDENVVFVGEKPLLSYILACMTLFHSGEEEVGIKARGKAISRAVDVAEVVKNRFTTDVSIKYVDIGTEQIATKDGRMINSSTIYVILKRYLE